MKLTNEEELQDWALKKEDCLFINALQIKI